MKIYIAVLTCLIAVNCWAQETKEPLFEIFSMSDCDPVPKLLQIEDELVVRCGGSDISDPNAKTYATVSRCFELRDTPNGQLIILQPKAEPPQPAKTLEYEGYYVTADYAGVPPSIKLTKEPEKYSYWKVPTDTEGPIVNISDFKRPAYLSLNSQITKFNYQGMSGSFEFRKIALSLDPKNWFQAKKINSSK